MSILRWFLSTTVRQAVDLKKQALKLVNHQRDILKPEDLAAIQASIDELDQALKKGAEPKELQERMKAIEETAGKRLKAYPDASMRENVEVILVAISVALAIRTFFLQPFKIPTGSMQPTLYGILSERMGPQEAVPSGWERFRDIFSGVSYVHEVAEEDGVVTSISRPVPRAVFSIFQKYSFNGKSHIIWFPPEYGTSLEERSGTRVGQHFRKGEDIFKLKVKAGDHLFVDRMTYNFRPPTRGEIVVFETKGISYPSVPQDQFYIKRLVGLGGERVRISDDRHLVINGQKLDSATPRFENLYSFENGFVGHERTGMFQEEKSEYQIGKNRLFVLGDNTRSSLDSRYWGDFSQEFIMGKSCFVYWPLLPYRKEPGRFGWSHR